MSNGNVTRLRSRMVAPRTSAAAPRAAPSNWRVAPRSTAAATTTVAPSHQGWCWDGTDWVWVDWDAAQPWPNQCPPALTLPADCCPPSDCTPSPPTCFSELAKWNACWDQSQSLTEFLTKVITDIFEDNPDIIPPPDPAAGSGPIIGVTDGSDAAPGEVGEYLVEVRTGTVSTGLGGVTMAAITLSPGDWDVVSELTISDLTLNFYFNGIGLQILNGGVLVGQFLLYNQFNTNIGGFTHGVFATRPFRMNVTVPTLLTGQANVYEVQGTGTGSATWTVRTGARRRR